PGRRRADGGPGRDRRRTFVRAVDGRVGTSVAPGRSDKRRTVSHGVKDRFGMRRSKYTRELLEPIVRESLSINQVLRKLSLRPTGGNYRMVHMRLRLLGI